MKQQSSKGTPDQQIAHQCRIWRKVDKIAFGEKRNVEKQRAEYRERQQLRTVVDNAGGES